MLTLIREHRSLFLGTALAGLALRLFFFVYFPTVTDDSRIYADLASNWLQHGIYGQTQTVQQITQIVPSDTRLPGYPAFLAMIFWLFGIDNFKAVLLTQILLDLFTCLIVADLARRAVSERAARIAFVLTALCPFLANYAAAALTETLEILFTTLALDGAVAALGKVRETSEGMGAYKLWAATGAAIAACILLRPDGGILLAAVTIYLVGLVLVWTRAPSQACPERSRRVQAERTGAPVKSGVGLTGWSSSAAACGPGNFRFVLTGGMIVVVFALAPLIPWTIRNFRTLHHFQPLAPRYATEKDEQVARGFNRWVKTWIVDYASVEEIYWSVPGNEIDPQKLPSRALNGPVEDNRATGDATLAVIADYNQSQEMKPELDARFSKLAADRIGARPVRYYVVLPLLRVADMWLRPRTEILPPDVRWWEFNDDTKQSVLAVGFGLLNLAYVAAALWTLVRRPSGVRWAGLLVCFLLLRSAFLGTLENPEPRYTLECYPVVIVCAAAFLARHKAAAAI